MYSKKSKRRIISIDGSHGEGGGQLVRVAICLSALSRQPISIENIRGGRPGGGGLKGQHLHAIDFLAKACGAKVSGAKLKSRSLTFEPAEEGSTWWEEGQRRECMDGNNVRYVEIEQETPGAVALILQAVLPFLLFTPVGASSSPRPSGSSSSPRTVQLVITGGTHVSFSPSLSYVEHVFLPNLALCGLQSISMMPKATKQGWGSSFNPRDVQKSLGSATFRFEPFADATTLKDFSDKLRQPRGKVTKVLVALLTAISGKDDLFSAICDAIGKENALQDVEIELVQSQDSGSERRIYILLVAETECGWRLGSDLLWEGSKKQKVPDENVLARKLVKDLVNEMGEKDGPWSGLDSHMMDQIAVYQALATTAGADNERLEKTFSDAGKEDLDGLLEDIGNINLNKEIDGDGDDAVDESTRHGPSLHTVTARWMCEEILGVRFDKEGFCEGAGLSSSRRS